MKKIMMLSIFFAIFALISCNVQDYNLRAIYDVDREYISPDSTSYHMAWKTESWRNKNVKYFSSAGVIITNAHNVFTHPEWLSYIVDGNGANNFEGAILVEYDPQYINIDWMAQPTGTFEGDMFDHFVQNNNTWLLQDENGDIVFSDPNYVIDPSAFSNAAFKLELTNIFTEYFDALHVALGEPAHVTYGYCFPDYNWQTYGPIASMTPTNVDPFNLGKTYDQYSLAEKSANIHPYQNNIIDTMNNAGCLIIRGDRLEHETPGASLLATKDINGVFFDNVDFSSMLSTVAKAASYRTAFTPTVENQSLLLIAGIKTDLYHAPSLYNQARLFQSMINAGVYFTPGYDGTKYAWFPDQQLADWWLRSSDDMNWGTHHMSPVYPSVAATPRKVIDRTVYNTVLDLGHPAYVHWHYQDYPTSGEIDYDTAALNDATVINTHAFREYDPQYPETAWVGYVDSVRVRNPDFVNIIYTSVHPRLDWENLSNESLQGRLWNTIDRIDQRMRAEGSPYGAWLRDKNDDIVENYANTTRIINPYAVYDGIADSLATVIVDELNDLTNDREYTGIFIDWLDEGYPDWACDGNHCYIGIDDGIDMDRDGIPYIDPAGLNPDLDESVGYALFCQTYLEALRDEFEERGMANRLIVVNGQYVRYNQAGADLVDGMMWEMFNIYTPGTASEANWDFAMNDVANMFTNSLLDPPFIAFESTSYDTSTGRFIAPIAMAGNGWANVMEIGDPRGEEIMFGLLESEQLPPAGALVSKEYIDVGTPSTTLDDTIHVVFENYEVYSVIKTGTATPWPYLAVVGGDTLSVGGNWRLVVDETPPTLSGTDAICGLGGDQQIIYSLADESVVYKTRYGYGLQLSKITLGAWSSYSVVYNPVITGLISSIALPATYFWKVEVMAKDASGNESISYSDYFQVTPGGDCP